MAKQIAVGQMTLTDMNDVVSSPTKPTNPTEGAMWFNEGDNQLYVYTKGGWAVSTHGFNIGDIVGSWVKSYSVNTSTPSILKRYNDSSFNDEFSYDVQARTTGTGTESTAVAVFQSKGDGQGWNLIKISEMGTSSNHPEFFIDVNGVPSIRLYGHTSLYNVEVKTSAHRGRTTPVLEQHKKIEDITETLGNMANDNLLNYEERKIIKDKLTEITGAVTADTTTALPTTSSLDSSIKGEFYSVRKSALNAGLAESDEKYIDVATEYNDLRNYLNAMTPVKPWDLRTTNQNENISVVKDTFRNYWLNYYTAVNNLAIATAEKLKQNVDDVVVGGANYARNGNFGTILDESAWKDNYVGGVKEIVDISTEAPPFKYAYHVSNVTNGNGGIFSPTIWEGAEAERLVDKEVTISFWLRYQNITQGTYSHSLGRFGELIIKGEKSDGTFIYSYPRAGTHNADSSNQEALSSSYISGTDTTWRKYVVTHKLSLPSGATKLADISFKHGLVDSRGEFWTTGIQIEIGNKVTDWKYSDLDMQEKLTDVTFKISDSEIISKVTSSETFATKVKVAEDNAKEYADDIEIGGRNLYKNSKSFKIGGAGAGNTVTLTEEGYLHVVSEEGNSNYVSSFIDTEGYTGLEESLTEGDNITISFSMKSPDHIDIPTIYLKSGMGYFPMKGEMSTEYSTVYTTVPWRKDNGLSFHMGFSGIVGTTIIRSMKIEKGTKATDWTPAPEELETEVTLMNKTLSEVVQVISEDGILTTLTETTAFKNALDTKADSETIGDLVTKDELGKAQEAINSEIGTQIDNIDFEPYVTKLEMEETSKNITAKFSATGGMNLLKNSVGYADLDFWYLGGADSAVAISTVSNQALDTLGFGSGFSFSVSSSDKALYQDVSVVAGANYTLSWYLNKVNTTSGSVFTVEIQDNGVTKMTETYSESTSGYETRSMVYVPESDLITIRIFGNPSEDVTITGMMFSIGDVPLQWSLATGEVYNTNIRMDINGIRVSQLDENRVEVGYTSITPTEFAGYFDTNRDGVFEKVFYLREDETVSKKFRAENEITMGSIKIIKVEKGGNKGWAFVPIVK